MANGKQVKDTLMTTTRIRNLQIFVGYVKGLHKLVDKTIQALEKEPIPQYYIEIRKYFSESSTELDKFRKAMDQKLKEVVENHTFPDCENGVLSLQIISSTRKGYNQGQADFIQQLSNNLVNEIENDELIKASGLKEIFIEVITKNGLKDIHKTLEKQFPPSTSESVKVK